MYKKQKIALAIIALAIACTGNGSYAQTGVLWSKTYGASKHATNGKVYITLQNADYVEPHRTSLDYHTKKFTDQGTLWTKAFGAPEFDQGHYMIDTPDGGKIMVEYNRDQAGDFKVDLTRTDARGVAVLRKTFHTRSEIDATVQKSTGKKQIVTGWGLTFSTGGSDVYRIQYNSDPMNETKVDGEIPSRFGLEQNYPNPFNPTTTISYSIAQSDFVKLKIFDLLGREVQTLVDKNQEAGTYTIHFDANKLASGVYFYKLQTKKFSESKKMSLVR